MMNEQHDNLNDVTERVERLISRRLDGEISPADDAELNNILAVDPAARRMLADYQRIDATASRVLSYDFDNAKTVARPRQHGGIRLAAAGAVLAAAAVVALSFLPDIFMSANRSDGTREFTAAPVSPVVPGGASSGGGFVPQFVDYTDQDYMPQERRQDVLRDVIGVRAKDRNNKDVIYIFERNAQNKRIVPITSDF